MQRYMLLFMTYIVCSLNIPAAVQAEGMVLNPVQQAEAQALYRELRCMVCDGEAIAESQATLAQDMRLQVNRLLHEGREPEEIRTYFAERYGESVLLRPRSGTHTALLWAGPLMLLFFGGVFLWAVLRRRSRHS